MMVVLNKVDMMDEASKDEKLTAFVAKLKESFKRTKFGTTSTLVPNLVLLKLSFVAKLKESFKRTKFGTNVEVVPVSASPREGEPQGIDELIHTILNDINIPERGDDH